MNIRKHLNSLRDILIAPRTRKSAEVAVVDFESFIDKEGSLKPFEFSCFRNSLTVLIEKTVYEVIPNEHNANRFARTIAEVSLQLGLIEGMLDAHHIVLDNPNSDISESVREYAQRKRDSMKQLWGSYSEFFSAAQDAYLVATGKDPVEWDLLSLEYKIPESAREFRDRSLAGRAKPEGRPSTPDKPSNAPGEAPSAAS